MNGLVFHIMMVEYENTKPKQRKKEGHSERIGSGL